MVVSAVGEDGRARHPRHHPRQRVPQPGHAHDHFLLHCPAPLGRCGTPQLARLAGLSHLETDHSHGGGAIPYQWNRHRGMHVREGLEPFEEAARRVYWDMAIYDKESMELLIKRVGIDNVLFATEMFGAVNAIDPKTGRNFEDIVPI